MASPSSNSPTVELKQPSIPQPNTPSEGRHIACALAIIAAISGSVLIGGGLSAYFQVGSLSYLTEIHSLALVGGGLILLAGGAIAAVKSRGQRTRLDFGPDAWKIWGVKVVDEERPLPQEINWDEKDPFFHRPLRENFRLVYIPEYVLVNGEKKQLTLDLLIEISKLPIALGTFRELGKLCIEFPRWVLVSTSIIPASAGKPREQLEEMINQLQETAEKCGYRLPELLEAVIFTLMVEAHTGKAPYGPNELTYCTEEVTVPASEGNQAITAHVGVGRFNRNKRQPPPLAIIPIFENNVVFTGAGVFRGCNAPRKPNTPTT
jgi:hypothetical protein